MYCAPCKQDVAPKKKLWKLLCPRCDRVLGVVESMGYPNEWSRQIPIPCRECEKKFERNLMRKRKTDGVLVCSACFRRESK